LNELIGFGADEYSSLGLYLPNGDDFVSPIIRDYLSNLDPETSLIGDKDEYNRERSGSWAGYRLFVIPLSVYISEVDDLVQAMRIGSYVVFIMIAIIVMVSVMVTYNLIIAERRKEVGTLRAMGFHKADILGLFLFEGLFLWLFALVGGGGLSVLLSYAISRISFDWIPGFSLFLENGRLLGLYRLESLAGNAVLLAVILVPALGIPVAKAVRRSIVECL
jgi:putative ABC transport system permease protein